MVLSGRIGGLALLGATAALPVAANAEFIYDNFVPFAGSGVFVGVDDWQGGDRMIVPDAGAGQMWVLQSLGSHFGTTAAGTYTDIIATVTLYRTINLTGTGPAFSDPFGTASWNIGGFVSTGPGLGADFILHNIFIDLSAPPTNPSIGYGIKLEYTATGPGLVVPHYADASSSIAGSSSSQGWYRDLNDDGILGADEYDIFAPWADANLLFELDALTAPVPEPATIIGLSVALSSLLVRRRRRRKTVI